MNRFETAALALVPGARVRIRVTSHEPYGVMVTVLGHETVGASVDAIMIDSPSGAPMAIRDEYPPVDAELEAVVSEVRAYTPPAWIRITLRRIDLDTYRKRCGFCGETTALNAGGDGVSIEVRSAEGPGAASIVAHRRCLIERLDPTEVGTAAQVDRIGQVPHA
jgi:hypothetical protein